MFTRTEMTEVRTAYTRHCLAAMRGNFTPLTLGQFAIRVLFVKPLLCA